MDISIKLNRIIEKYELDFYYPEYKNLLRARYLLKEFGENTKGKILCIGTCSDDIDRFMCDTGYKLDVDKLLVCEIESKRQYYASSFNYKRIIDSNPMDYDLVLIISWYGMQHIKWFLRENGIPHMSIYDYFNSKGLFIEHNYNEFFGDKSLGKLSGYGLREQTTTFSTLPGEMFSLKEEIETSNNADYCIICLKKLLFLTLVDKDIFAFMELLEKYKYTYNLPKEKSALIEIKKLYTEIKNTIKRRSGKIIAIYWIDQVSYNEHQKLTYLNNKKNTGIWFTNMYTHTPYTTTAFSEIFCEERDIEKIRKNKGMLDESNSTLIEYLKKKRFRILSIDNKWGRELKNKYRPDVYFEEYSSFSARIWEYLRDLCMNEGNGFYFIHELMETHDPFLCWEMTGDCINNMEKRRHKCMEYVSKRLTFLDEFDSKDIINIYMSDHGDYKFEGRFHIIFSVQGTNIEDKKVEGLVPLSSFKKIMQQLIEDGKIKEEDIAEKYIKVSDTCYYNGMWLGKIIKDGSLQQLHVGYNGIIDENNIYIKFADGSQALFPNDISKNRFGVCAPFVDSIYDYRVLKKYDDLEIPFPKIERKNDKYAWVWKDFFSEEIANYNKKKFEIIIRTLNSIREDKVAIRTGGVHTKALLKYIAGINKEKNIKWIIDNNKECHCKDLGVEIITVSKSKELNIKEIIWVSKELRETFLEERKNYETTGVRIIDFYDHLEENGIFLKHYFWEWEIDCVDKKIDFPFDDVGV